MLEWPIMLSLPNQDRGSQAHFPGGGLAANTAQCATPPTSILPSSLALSL